MATNWLRTATSLVALLGIADAAYLTLQHYQNVIPPCTTSGCEQVLTSEYAVVFGVPVALIGLGYYLAVFALSRAPSRRALLWQLIVVTLGLVASGYFVYLQLSVIGALCTYCLVSAGTTALVWLLTIATLTTTKGTSRAN